MNELNLDSILSDLKGLGVKELGIPLEIETANGGKVTFTISNIPTSQEIEALLSAEEYKGHHWMQRIKCEILSRAITTINGVRISELKDPYVVDQLDPSRVLHIRSVLRELMFTWGPETLQVVWRVFMNHCQNLEDQLMASFPEAAVITEYERRFYEKTLKIVDEFTREMVAEEMGVETPPTEE